MNVIRKISKFIFIAFLIFLIISCTLYWYLLHNAENLLRKAVDFESKGAIELTIRELRFDIGELRLSLLSPSLHTKDSTNKHSTFSVSMDTVVMELATFKPVLFGEMIRVDSIIIKKPSISIVKRKSLANKNDFSLPQQMGKAYRNLDMLLQRLSIKYCLVDSGSFKLVDLTKPGCKPMIISDYYLLIDNMRRSPDNDLPDRFLFSDRIKFYSSHQQIQSIDGNHELRFSSLRINSFRKTIELDSCYVYRQKQQGGFNKFSGFFDTLKFTNVDFARFAEQNILDADSVYCINPKLIIQTSVNSSSNNNKKFTVPISRDSLSEAVKVMMGNFEIRNLGVTNASINLLTRKDKITSSYQISRVDFTMKDVMVIDRPEFPVKVKGFDLGLIGYKATDSKGNYTIQFDSIRLVNDKIQLSNFSVRSNVDNKHQNSIKDIRMRSLFIKNISWVELMASKKIVADEIELADPLIHTEMIKRQSVRKPGAGQFFNTIRLAASFVDVSSLKISNAEIGNQNSDSTGYLFRGMNMTIDVNRFLKSRTYHDMSSSISGFSFHQGDWSDEKQHLKLTKGSGTSGFQNVLVKKIEWEGTDSSMRLSLNGLEINNIKRIEEDGLDLGSVKWEEGGISMRKKKSTMVADNLAKIFHIHTDTVSGKNTVLSLASDSLNFHTIIDRFNSTQLNWSVGDQPNFESLSLKGNFMDLNANLLKLHSGAYSFDDHQPSFVRDISIAKLKRNAAVEAEIKSIQFKPYFQSLLRKSFHFSDLVVEDPVLQFNGFQHHDTQSEALQKSFRFPELDIRSITVRHPVIKGLILKNGMKINAGNENGEVRISRISSISSLMNIDKLKILLTGFQAEHEKYRIRVPENSYLITEITQANLTAVPDSSRIIFDARIDSLSLKAAEMTLIDSVKGHTHWDIKNVKLKHLKFDAAKEMNAMSMLLNDDSFEVEHLDASFLSRQSQLAVKGFQYVAASRQISFDSLLYRPAEDLPQYMKSNLWQKDYMTFSAGKSVIDGLKSQTMIREKSIQARKITVNDAALSVYKDKRLPFKKGITKLSPAELISTVGIPLSLDTISLENATVKYEEYNDKTQKAGVVKFSGLQAQILNVNNIRLRKTDSIRLTASGVFMDSAHLRFRFTQAYADSVNSFNLALRFRPFNMKTLNPILDPLATTLVNTGSLDTLRLNAIGNDSATVGKMRMYYTGLKIKFIGPGGDSLRTLKSRLITFLANDVLIKRNNRKGYGMVYANRDKERSFANYWMKIVVSGVISSSGIKSNRKVERKYHKGIIKMNIPELPEVNL